MSRILVIDDEPAMGENIRRLLGASGEKTEVHTDPVKGLAAALADPPDVLLLDVRMPGLSGEEVFTRLHAAAADVPVIFLTAYGSVEGAVVAMRNGAFDYLRKPFEREELLLAVRRALDHRRVHKEVATLKGRLAALGQTDLIESRNDAMQGEIRKAGQAAATDATVLILGESGTGKEVMARWIHARSPRADGPFVPIDCTALPQSLIESELFGHEKGAFTGASERKKGLIESGRGGSLFFDEVGDLPPEAQTSLFRFLAEHRIRRVGGVETIPVDCRILCATNQDLKAKIQAGTFREELYYRLAVVTLTLPPLRERPEDIPVLARHFLEAFTRSYGKEAATTPALFDALLERSWRGNIRELRNCIERLVALGVDGTIDPDLVGEEGPSRNARRDLLYLNWKEAREQYLADFQQAYASALLKRCGGNVSAAAREAGVDRKTFYGLLPRSSRSGGGE